MLLQREIVTGKPYANLAGDAGSDFNEYTINWFNIAGIIVGAACANLLQWGIAAINAMVVAAVFFFIGEMLGKNK